MGKKMGLNTKAVAKKEQRAEHASSKAAAAAKKQEDEHWAGVKASESTKRGAKKEEASSSKEERDARRAEARRLAKEEELAMLDYGKKPTKAKNKGGAKVTQKELAERRAKKEAKEAKNREELAQQKLNITTEDDYARMVGQKIDNRSTDVVVSGVDDALAAAGEMMSIGEDAPVDKHPEKRMKAAFKAYEEQQMPIMRQDYPGLKLSQYKERIFQQWQKAPENPMNQ